jgi:segregation and condensation protein B
MAIIAYKQPITRLEIDEIRGVGSDYSIQILVNNNLIEVVGRKDVLGKPLLFGTTDEFLKRFELDDINNLPSYEELLEKIKVIQTNFDGSLYNSNRGEEQSFNDETSTEGAG